MPCAPLDLEKESHGNATLCRTIAIDVSIGTFVIVGIDLLDFGF